MITPNEAQMLRRLVANHINSIALARAYLRAQIREATATVPKDTGLLRKLHNKAGRLRERMVRYEALQTKLRKPVTVPSKSLGDWLRYLGRGLFLGSGRRP